MDRLRRWAGMVFRKTAYRIFRAGGVPIDYAKEVGDPAESSIVAAVLLWISRTFPEAPPILFKQLPGGVEEPVYDHPLLRLLQRPNEYYSGPILWMATTVDYYATGDAYWILEFSRAGTPVGIWYAPSWMMEPRGDDGAYLTHYEYRVDGETFRLPPEQVVHFRYGLDAQNDRKGCSPLLSALREIYTDNEAAAFTASILRNMGVPGVIVSPAPGVQIDDGDAEMTKAAVMANFTGDKRGEPLVMTGATQVAQFGFSPEQLILRELRRIPEERITALTGIPAVVVGLGAGLDRSTFTNMGEARVAAYEAGLIPTQRIMAEDVRWQLLSLFEEDPYTWRFAFDLTKVRCLQEDLYRQTQRADLAWRGGWALRSETRRVGGLPVDEQRDDVFLQQANTVLVDAAQSKGGEPATTATPAAPAQQNGNGNGNGAVALADHVAAEVVAALDRQRLLEGSPS